MDVTKTSLSRIQFDALPAAARNILQKLEQAGLCRALVIESKGQQVLLDTAFGKLSGQSPQALQKGDQILARIVQEQSLPTIKIEQLQLRQPVLTQKVLRQLIKLAAAELPNTSSKSGGAQKASTGDLSQIIRVIDHERQQTQIQMGQKTYSIPRQNNLNPGDTLLLRLNDKQQPEVRRIDPPQLLKKAFSELLPRLQAGTGRTPALASLQKLVSSILQLKAPDLARPAQTLQRIIEAPAANSALSAKQPTTRINAENTSHSGRFVADSARVETTTALKITTPSEAKQSPNAPNRPAATIANPQATQRVITQLLQQLSRPAANAGRIDAQAIRQVLSSLSLLPSTPTAGSNPVPQAVPQQIQLLQQIINQSPQAMRDLVLQVIQSQHAGMQKVTVDEAPLQELSSLLRSELLQQLDQTSTQLLLQKTTLKLNQELQQPIQINLNIPLQLKEDTVQLKLKLKQQQQNEQPQTQQWEIDLSFDLPLLGLISTRLLLQESKLSASFWAVRDSTRLLIDSHLHQFKQQLVNSGFELGAFHSFPGQPAKHEQDDPIQGQDRGLLDVKA